jgi:hypothetical protein
MAVRDAQPIRRCCVRPAALRPYPAYEGRRPVALRPTLSSGLPLSSVHLCGCRRLLPQSAPTNIRNRGRSHAGPSQPGQGSRRESAPWPHLTGLHQWHLRRAILMPASLDWRRSPVGAGVNHQLSGRTRCERVRNRLCTGQKSPYVVKSFLGITKPVDDRPHHTCLLGLFWIITGGWAKWRKPLRCVSVFVPILPQLAQESRSQLCPCTSTSIFWRMRKCEVRKV